VAITKIGIETKEGSILQSAYEHGSLGATLEFKEDALGKMLNGLTEIRSEVGNRVDLEVVRGSRESRRATLQEATEAGIETPPEANRRGETTRLEQRHGTQKSNGWRRP